MSTLKPRVSRSFAYGLTFLGSATSPGIAWQDIPIQSSTPTGVGVHVVVQSRNNLLRDRASKLEQLLSLSAVTGTGGSDTYARSWVEAASELPTTDRELAASLDTSDAVATIRAALSLQVKELAAVLGVKRPTIYAWLRGEAKPQPQNRTRIAHLLKFAKDWNAISKMPVGASVRMNWELTVSRWSIYWPTQR